MSDAPAATDAPKKAKPKLILLILVGLVLGGGGLGGYFFLMKKSAPVETPPPAAAAAESKEPAAETPTKAQIITLKPIVVNLRNSKATRFLKVTLGFQTNAKKAVEDLTKLSPEIADFLVNKLSDLEVTDIDNMAGRTKLKREIQNGVNELLEGGYISGVFFTEFVIQ